jgi:hypothetical protein
LNIAAAGFGELDSAASGFDDAVDHAAGVERERAGLCDIFESDEVEEALLSLAAGGLGEPDDHVEVLAVLEEPTADVRDGVFAFEGGLASGEAERGGPFINRCSRVRSVGGADKRLDGCADQLQAFAAQEGEAALCLGGGFGVERVEIANDEGGLIGELADRGKIAEGGRVWCGLGRRGRDGDLLEANGEKADDGAEEENDHERDGALHAIGIIRTDATTFLNARLGPASCGLGAGAGRCNLFACGLSLGDGHWRATRAAHAGSREPAEG